MGLDAYGKTILGIQVDRNHFFTPTGQHRECARCHRQQPESVKFCPEDGQRIVDVTEEAPTPAFAAYAAHWDSDPQQVFADLCEVYQPGVVGLMRIDSIQSNEDRRPPRLALGCLLAETASSNGGSNKVLAVAAEDLPFAKLRAVAAELNVVGPVQIFTCLYLSC